MGVAVERPVVTARVLSSHCGRAVTAQERDVARGNNKWKGSMAGLGGVGLLVSFLSIFVVACTPCAFLE